MKLKVPAEFTGQIRDADGLEYIQTSDGTVTIPDDKVHDSLWGFGFTQVQQSSKQTSTSSTK